MKNILLSTLTISILFPYGLFANDAKIKGLVYSGFSWINKEAIKEIDLNDCSDFETVLYQSAIDLGRTAHFIIDGLWFSIDTPKDLQIINMKDEKKQSPSGMAEEYKMKLGAQKS